MILSRKLTLIFAGVAVAVGVAVDGLGLLATSRALREQTDRTLTQAVRTLGQGGIPDGLPYRAASGTGTGQAVPGVGGPGPGSLVRGVADGGGGARPPRLLIAQRLDAAGRVSAVGFTPTGLPVDAADVAIAAGCDPRVRRFRDLVVDGSPYRMVTQCPVPGGPAYQVARSAQDAAEVGAELFRWMTLLTALVVAAAGLTGRFVARRFTRRLTRLTAVAEKVSSTGRLEVKVPARGRDEVGLLGSAIDDMLGELARARDDQRRLVQNAGHELKTPLTSIRTNVSLLARLDELPARARLELLADLRSETAELTTLIEEVIELATDRRAEEPPRPVELGPLVHRVVERAARRTGREFLVDCDDLQVVGRPGALERAVTNLVDNAAKFDHGGSAPIEVLARAGRIEVRDRGPGIAEPDLDRVFDRFHRADAARGMPGSGLGLAIVAHVAQTHDGSVFAANRPGGGAVIGFTVGTLTGAGTLAAVGTGPRRGADVRPGADGRPGDGPPPRG